MNCLEKKILETSTSEWDWKLLTKNKAISLEFIIKTIEDFSWDIRLLSGSMPLHIINIYYKTNWDWRLVSTRARAKDILKYKNIKWDWHVLSSRSQIVYGLLSDHPELPWIYKVLSSNNLGKTERNTEVSSAIIQNPSMPEKDSVNNNDTPITLVLEEENIVEYTGDSAFEL
jgi:hypothetical protein